MRCESLTVGHPSLTEDGFSSDRAPATDNLHPLGTLGEAPGRKGKNPGADCLRLFSESASDDERGCVSACLAPAGRNESKAPPGRGAGEEVGKQTDSKWSQAGTEARPRRHDILLSARWENE